MGVDGMTILVAHLHTLRTWFFSSGRHRLLLFLSTIPILWLFWGICCPLLASREIDFKTTFFALFAAWYSLLNLQDFTNNDSKWVTYKSYHLPTCPSLPISPLVRMGAELLFFLIISILIFIPFFLLYFLLTSIHGYKGFTAIEFLRNAVKGTLAIAPIIFCIRMNVNGTFILPTSLRMALPVVLCGAFILFQITGLFITLSGSIVLFISQTVLLYLIFIWFHGPHNRLRTKGWIKYFPFYMIDEFVFTLLLGKRVYKKAASPKAQILIDLSRVITFYIILWMCIYFPVLGVLYYIFIHIMDKPVMYWFFFFLLLLLPTQDSHALTGRFIIPILSLPLRQDVILQRFYLIFTTGIALIWTVPILLVALFEVIDLLSHLPLILSFAPTAAGIWINRISNKQVLIFFGVLLICCLPLGYYLDLVREYTLLFYLTAFIGALLPFKSMTFSQAKL
jgi:hypothetical protein